MQHISDNWSIIERKNEERLNKILIIYLVIFSKFHFRVIFFYKIK